MNHTNMGKTLKVDFNILKDEKVGQDIKTYIILTMYANNEITLNKAKELFTEVGVFSEHWMEVDGKATNLFMKEMEQGLNLND